MNDDRSLHLHQEYLPGLSSVDSAVDELAQSSNVERGAIFTRVEVVNFLLDLIEYTPSQKLQNYRLLEPSFGHGDFLLPAVERLLESLRKQGLKPNAKNLVDSIRAVELHADSFRKARNSIEECLSGAGMPLRDINIVLDRWLLQGDFLLTQFEISFTHTVGNPPYIRNEMIPSALQAEYRKRYKTMFDRADIYIPFIEHSLGVLDKGGVLGFICADRWMKNRYGGPLRELVRTKFHLRTHVDMVGTNAFHSEVIAYPAVTVIANEAAGPTYIAVAPKLEARPLKRLSSALVKGRVGRESVKATTITSGPWILEDSDTLHLVRRLEDHFPTLEEAGCKVGIGVATGADSVFIGQDKDLNIEKSRKLPIVMTKDIRSGEIEWKGNWVINPFEDAGGVVPLEKYPKLKAYFERHEEFIKRRHVSQKNPNGWYRTIDRMYPEIVRKEKLLIPDIKSDAQIVYDEGKYYPHHNLYYITSNGWDLKALRSVLLSGIARIFIEAYSTRMHGDCLRFQAQYLRRIRLPRWKDVSESLRAQLRAGGADKDHLNKAVGELYGLTECELNLIA